MEWHSISELQSANRRLQLASFNDDSSPRQDKTEGLKVSIDAQVLPGKRLDWYYEVLSWFPNVVGELKSPRVIEQFNQLPGERSAEIWRKGLSQVRIHIVDPRPYKARMDSLLRSAWKRDDAPALLRQWVLEGTPKPNTSQMS